MQLLAAGGAHPFLLVHGAPTVEGATADWWREVGQVGDIVYEAYYNASSISALGPVLGNRRVRLGMRSVVSQYTSIGIPTSRLGFMLGFHSAQTPGIGGRQGLQPREEWLRIVKWQALAARQIALDHATSSIWSWGWGTFGPLSVDADKAAAACVWLWARDSSLCNGPAAGGSAFEASLAEGQILLGEAYCAFPSGHVTATAVDELTAFAEDRHTAVTALVARAVLSSAARVTDEEVVDFERDAVERAFDGSQAKYERALARRKATVAIARGVIRDELRRRAIQTMLARKGSTQTTLEFTAANGTKASTT